MGRPKGSKDKKRRRKSGYLQRWASKKTTPIKTGDKAEELKEGETEQVTPVKTVTPATSTSKPKKEPLKPVIISDMPTKKPVSPVNFAENDKAVFDWYNNLSGGQTYTMKQAAKEVGMSVEELENSFTRLQHRILPEHLGHISDWKQ